MKKWKVKGPRRLTNPIYLGGDLISTRSLAPNPPKPVEIPDQVRTSLASKTLGGDRSQVVKILEKYFLTMAPEVDLIFLKAAIIQIFYQHLGLALKMEGCRTTLGQVGLDCIENIIHSNTIIEVSQYAQKGFGAIAEELYRGRKETNAQVFQQAMDFITENYYQDLSLGLVARHVHISPHHLSRNFQNYCGMKLSQYITQKRIEKAKELLLATDLPVGEVGTRVGYNDPNYFGRVFKNHVGVPPSTFRSNLGH